MQVKTSKKAWISLFFFGGIWTFQWVTGEKIKKIPWPLTRVSGCGQTPEIQIFRPFLSPRGPLRERGGQTPRMRKI
jgi:hypothetical protein